MGPQPAGMIGTWRLLRWQYDGAPLIAEHPGPARYGGGWTVEIDSDGDLMFDELPYGAQPTVPAAILRALVNDAIARGVWPAHNPGEGAQG